MPRGTPIVPRGTPEADLVTKFTWSRSFLVAKSISLRLDQVFFLPKYILAYINTSPLPFWKNKILSSSILKKIKFSPSVSTTESFPSPFQPLQNTVYNHTLSKPAHNLPQHFKTSHRSGFPRPKAEVFFKSSKGASFSSLIKVSTCSKFRFSILWGVIPSPRRFLIPPLDLVSQMF